MNNEKFKELWENDELEEVHEELDDSYRHGNYVWTVYKYGEEYWGVNYTVSGDGEYHGIREDDFDLQRVFPHTVVTKTTEYSTKLPKNDDTIYHRKQFSVEAMQYRCMDVSDLEGTVAYMEKFLEWIEKVRGEDSVKLIGALLSIGSGSKTTNYPNGFWIIKEPGKDLYGLSDQNFKKEFEK